MKQTRSSESRCAAAAKKILTAELAYVVTQMDFPSLVMRPSQDASPAGFARSWNTGLGSRHPCKRPRAARNCAPAIILNGIRFMVEYHANGGRPSLAYVRRGATPATIQIAWGGGGRPG